MQYLWLPLAHVFGKVLTSGQIEVGHVTAVDGRVDKIIENLPTVRPTYMAAVPRIFEKEGIVYASGFCGSGVVWAPWVGMHAAHKLMGHDEGARTAFDLRPPASIPLYRGNPWFMPAIFQGYQMPDRIALWRASR